MGTRKRKGSTEGSFWISYSDLATSLMLVFVLIVCVMSMKMQKQLAEKQDKLDDVKTDVESLLGRRTQLSERLKAAVTSANKDIGREVFGYANGEVFVSDVNGVAWFESDKADLSAAGKHQVGMFYQRLYKELLGGGKSLPPFLESINIQGHTDALSRTKGGGLWTWESYNGTASTRHADGNLWLSQQRAKAILDRIQEMYTNHEVDEDEYPWRPFAAVAQVTGRSWTRSFCDVPKLGAMAPSAMLTDTPCLNSPADSNDEIHKSSRRVTFSFDLNDKAILESLQGVLDRAAVAP